MNITIDIQNVDYIALCPGYTCRLLHDENTYETIDDTETLSKIRRTDKEYSDFYNKYGYNISKPNLKKVTTPGGPEMKFWDWNLCDCDGENDRQLGDKISDCSNYSEHDYESETNFINDFTPIATPVLIGGYDVFVLDDRGMDVINTFCPKYQKNLQGSIVFAPYKDNTLELVDWIKLSRGINIDFCACYDPVYPYNMKIVYVNGKSILIVEFDCESG